MKIYFRGGIYITLMKMIIFMKVCFPLSRKTDPLTKSRVSGSAARLAVEVGQAPRSTRNSCMSLNVAEFAGGGASSRAAGSRVRG
jgi:hypothetical protein